MQKQKTIRNEITVSGTGLHTGEQVMLTFKPAEVNAGYKFKRTDLDGQPVIDASTEHVKDTSRGTNIEKDGVWIRTVEHVLAALAGCEIDNILIEVNKAEMPVLDGSSKQYVNAIKEAGIVEQEAEKEFLEITETFTFSNPEKGAEFIAIPSDRFRVSVMIDYDTRVLGTQNAHLDKIEDFSEEIGSCRTFVFLHELEYLLEHQLIKGGDLNNALVYVNKVVSQAELDRLAGLFNKPAIQVLQAGILNNTEPHFANEPARHKLLDLVGDLALLGRSLKAHIIATKPGHQSNVAFAKALQESFIQPKQPTKRFNVYATPVYDINAIKKMLPHRPPFLLIDKILELTDQRVVGLKSVTMNEPFFVGHFPDEPVMPGVLQVEAMAQVGGIFALNTVPDPENYVTYFMKLQEVKFRSKVVPGDVVVFELVLASPFRRGICHMKGKAYVGDTVVMEGELVAQIVKSKNQN